MEVFINYKAILNEYVGWYLIFYLATDLLHSIAYYMIPQIAFISAFFIVFSSLLSGLFNSLLYIQPHSTKTSTITNEKCYLSIAGVKYSLLFKVLLITLIDLTHYLLIGFTNYPSYIAILQCLQIVFMALLSKIRLKLPMFRKHFIVISIVLIGILIGSLIKVEISLFENYALLILLSSLCFSIKCVEEKVILDENILNVPSLLFLEGLFGLGLYAIFCFFTLRITCKDTWRICSKYNPVFDFIKAILNLFRDRIQYGIMMIVFCLLHIGKNIRMQMLNAFKSPVYIGMINSLLNFVNSIAVLMMQIILHYQVNPVVIFFVIVVSIALMGFGSAVYIECICFSFNEMPWQKNKNNETAFYECSLINSKNEEEIKAKAK